jgi:hypothetical protein
MSSPEYLLAGQVSGLELMVGTDIDNALLAEANSSSPPWR